MLKHFLCALTAMLCLALPAMAQAPAVLERVPADSVVVVVVKNLADTGAKVDKFIADIGLGGQLPGPLVALLQEKTRIREGVDTQGSAAFAFIDPPKYGWDLVAAVKEDRPPREPPPVVIILPGKDPKVIFAAYSPTEAEGVTEITIQGEKLYAKASGDFTVMGPRKDVVLAAAGASEFIGGRIGRSHQELIARADAFVWADMKALSPVLVAVIDKVQEQFTRMQEHMGPDQKAVMGAVAAVMPLGRDVYQQMEAVTLAVRIDRPGVFLDTYVSYLPDSLMGKFVAAVKPAGKLLDKLPGLPYVLAVGANVVKPEDPQLRAQMEQMAQKMGDALKQLEAIKSMPPELRERAEAALGTLQDQVTGLQIYAGGSGQETGVFGVSVVLTVKDAKATMAAIADLVPAGDNLLHTAAGAPETVKVQYLKGAAGAADAIVLDPGSEANERTRREMGKVLGEERLALYVMPVGDKTVVLTFGGGTGFLAKATEAATSGGKLQDDPALGEALALLPKDPIALILLNPTNLLEVWRTTVRAFGEEPPGPFRTMKLENKMPLAIAESVRANGEQMTIFVPTTLVADIVRGVQQAMQSMQEAMQEAMQRATMPASAP